MQIMEHITEHRCFFCNAVMVEEKRCSLHTNGHWNEYRTFRCGRRIHFSPNFMRVEIEQECPKEPKEKTRLEIKADSATLLEIIEYHAPAALVRKFMTVLNKWKKAHPKSLKDVM